MKSRGSRAARCDVRVIFNKRVAWTNPQRKAVHAVSHTRIPQCHKVKEDEQRTVSQHTGVRCYIGAAMDILKLEPDPNDYNVLRNLALATPMHQRWRFESTVWDPGNTVTSSFFPHTGPPGRRGAPDSRGSRDAAPGDGRSSRGGRWPVFTSVACLLRLPVYHHLPRCGPCLVPRPRIAYPAQLFSGTARVPEKALGYPSPRLS